MTFKLLQYSGDRNALHKHLDSVSNHEMTGYSLTDPSEVVNPVIKVDSRQNEDGTFDPTNYNMAYIPEFQRYYWITDMTAEDNYIWRIYMHSDPLASFETHIEGLAAFGLRTASASKQSPEIIDTSAPYKANDWVTNYVINTFTECSNYVLVTAG